MKNIRSPLVNRSESPLANSLGDMASHDEEFGYIKFIKNHGNRTPHLMNVSTRITVNEPISYQYGYRVRVIYCKKHTTVTNRTIAMGQTKYNTSVCWFGSCAGGRWALRQQINNKKGIKLIVPKKSVT
jgi:hypothetical protein